MSATGELYRMRMNRNVQPSATVLYDRTRWGNNGVITGVTPTLLDTRLYVYNFNGVTDFVQITNNGSLEVGTSDFTVMAWIKAQTGADADAHIYSRRGGPGSDGFYFTIQNASGRLRIYGEGTGGFGAIQAATTPVQTNRWTFVAVVRTSAAIEFFVNAVSLGSQAKTYGDMTAVTDAFIGSESAVPQNRFLGQMAFLQLVKFAVPIHRQFAIFRSQKGWFGL